MPFVVKILTDDDGAKHPSKDWHYVNDFGQGQMALCTGEFFGMGESSATYKTKDGKITCEKCRKIIKHFKAIKL